MERNNSSFKERFLLRVLLPENLNDCWKWTGSLRCNGYGQVSINNKMYLSHRVSFELFVGPIPDNLHVLHHCDNRACVNPSHLFLGTNYDNIQDRESKGRGKVPKLKGEDHAMHKLLEQDVYNIRSLCDEGKYTQTEIAKMFGIGCPQVSAIKHRKSWGWLK